MKNLDAKILDEMNVIEWTKDRIENGLLDNGRAYSFFDGGENIGTEAVLEIFMSMFSEGTEVSFLSEWDTMVFSGVIDKGDMYTDNYNSTSILRRVYEESDLDSLKDEDEGNGILVRCNWEGCHFILEKSDESEEWTLYTDNQNKTRIVDQLVNRFGHLLEE